MDREVLGNFISSTVAFIGLALIFCVISWIFEKLGIGPVFGRPKKRDDDPE